MTDKIDAAIDAAAAKPPVLVQYNAIISSTGRPAALLLPEDASDGEILEVVGWIGVVILGHFRAERAKSANGRIEIARSMPARPA